MTWNIDLFVGIILSMKYSVFCLFLLSVIYSTFLDDCSSESEALALFEQSWSDDTPLDTDVIATVQFSSGFDCLVYRTIMVGSCF